MAEAPCMFESPPASERPWQRTHVRSPGGDETFVAVPPLHDAQGVAAGNAESLSSAETMIQGRSLQVLREATRRDALRVAAEYTAELLGQMPDDVAASLPDPAAAPLYVGGHQPALFHPGVWVKNFAVAAMARADQGIGLNLVVDNDTMPSTGIRLPMGDRDRPRFETALFDEPRAPRPWEEARIVNRTLFASFPARVMETMRGWGFEPLVGEFWTAAIRHSERSDRLADCLTAARSHWERRWGSGNLELPLSRLCRLDSFLWFASHILAHLPRFHGLYNQVLREYRCVNGLRSRTHPVPDLRENQGWYEAPFWIWREGDSLRQRLFARQEGNEVQLSNGSQPLVSLPLTPARDACCAVEALRKFQDDGWRFRTRALTTTLFSRLCLADLFVHGLGGAIYDEMTDRLMTRFFRLPAPGFMMLSATVRLPLPAHGVQREDERRLRRQMRELDYNSDRYLPASPSAECVALVDEKARLVAVQRGAVAGRIAAAGVVDGGDIGRRVPFAPPSPALPPQGGKGEMGMVDARGVVPDDAGLTGPERYRRLKEINRELSDFTLAARQNLTDELAKTVDQLAANTVLQNREYAYCLFPADKLRRFMDHVCSTVGT